MTVSILVFEDCIAMPSVSTMEYLSNSNNLHKHTTGTEENVFHSIELVSCGEKRVKSRFGLPIDCHRSIREVKQTDLLIIPALDGDIDQQMEKNRDAPEFILRMYRGGADIVSFCTGAFLLAETGLLSGKSATTHWLYQDLFRERYPDITLKGENIIVDEGRIMSSGGATSFQNLVMYLLEKYCGKATAHLASKIYLIDLYKNSQNAYAIFSSQKKHHDELILKAQNLMEETLPEQRSIQEIADHMAISKRNFIRRFKKATDNTPQEYLHRIRVEYAKRELESSDKTFSEIVRSIGYEDIGYFRKIFVKFTGISPSRYRQKYSWS